MSTTPKSVPPKPKPLDESVETSPNFIRRLNLISPSFGVPRQDDTQFLLEDKTITGDISIIIPQKGVFSPVIAAGWVRVKVQTNPVTFVSAGAEQGPPSSMPSLEIDDPDITSVKPLQALVGTTITITGTDFDTPPGKVLFTDGIFVDPISWTNTSITVKIPTNAESGPLQVITNEGRFSNSVQLTVDVPVDITTVVTSIRVSAFDEDGNKEILGECVLAVTATGITPTGGSPTPAATTSPTQAINVVFPFLSDMNVTSMAIRLINLQGTVSIEVAATSGDPEVI